MSRARLMAGPVVIGDQTGIRRAVETLLQEVPDARRRHEQIVERLTPDPHRKTAQRAVGPARGPLDVGERFTDVPQPAR